MPGARRPDVDVVVPVAAADANALAAAAERLRSSLELRDGDRLTVVDNRGVGLSDPVVLVAPEVRPYLLTTAATAALDAPPDSGLAARFTAGKASMSQEPLLARGRWAFAQSATAGVRREAFLAVGGFAGNVRSGGDADLCWRLQEAGWQLASRPGAEVVHETRRQVRALLAQRVRHGTGAGWLDARWPGALPPRRWPGLVRWGLGRGATGAAALLRGTATPGPSACSTVRRCGPSSSAVSSRTVVRRGR